MLVFSAPARGQNSSTKPAALRDVGIDQKLNAQVPLDATFRDETARTVRLGDYFNGKPVILSLVYFECPMLCPMAMHGLLVSLQQVSWTAGKEFNVLTVSFNPRETPELAASKRNVYLGLYNRPGSDQGWHFLTGEEASIERLAQAVGFRYHYDSESGQYAHPTMMVALTPEGKVSRYLYGIEYPERDVRLALVEASNNKIGTAADQALLFCYHYDPKEGKYGFAVMNVIRAAGIATVLLLGGAMLIMFRRENYRKESGDRSQETE
jgi:protein SCO1/2